MKCDVIALGLIAAIRETGIKIPLVVRLQGMIFFLFFLSRKKLICNQVQMLKPHARLWKKVAYGNNRSHFSTHCYIPILLQLRYFSRLKNEIFMIFAE